MSQTIKKSSDNKLAFQGGSSAEAGSGGCAQLPGCSGLLLSLFQHPELSGQPWMCLSVPHTPRSGCLAAASAFVQTLTGFLKQKEGE